MSKEPSVCICIPTFNSSGTLSETLTSILGQTYRDISVIVVDNASVDSTVEIAESFAARDPRLMVSRHSENIGAEGNFTRCISLASGEYTAIYHADDLYAPEMVQEEVSFLEKNPGVGAVFTGARSIDADGKPGRVYSLPGGLAGTGPVYGFGAIFKTILKYGNFLFCPSAMVRTRIYRDHIKIWDAARYKTSADLDVWLRILQCSDIGIISTPLLSYRGAAETSFSYNAARAKTSTHDIFLVLDHYASGAARSLMGSAEQKDYALLRLKDNINRAFNLAFLGNRREARRLLPGIFHAGNVVHALKSPTHLKVLLYGCAVLFFSFLPLPERVWGFVFRFRHG